MTIITLPTRIDTATNNRLMPELYWPPAPINNSNTSNDPYNNSACSSLLVNGISTFYKRQYFLQADADQNTSSGKDPLFEATEQDEQAPFKQRTGRQMEEEMFDAGIMCFHDVLAALKEH